MCIYCVHYIYSYLFIYLCVYMYSYIYIHVLCVYIRRVYVCIYIYMACAKQYVIDSGSWDTLLHIFMPIKYVESLRSVYIHIHSVGMYNIHIGVKCAVGDSSGISHMFLPKS